MFNVWIGPEAQARVQHAEEAIVKVKSPREMDLLSGSGAADNQQVMTMFTCSTCGKVRPENYCPECAHTIDRSVAQQRPVTASSSLVNVEASKRSSNTGVFQYRGSEITGKTTRESLKQRVGVALACLCLGLAALALGLYMPIEEAKSAK